MSLANRRTYAKTCGHVPVYWSNITEQNGITLVSYLNWSFKPILCLKLRQLSLRGIAEYLGVQPYILMPPRDRFLIPSWYRYHLILFTHRDPYPQSHPPALTPHPLFRHRP